MNKEERKTLCKDEFNNCEIVIENKQLQSQLETANKKLKKIEEYCKDNNEYMGSDSYINGLNEGNREVKNDILSIMYLCSLIKGDE